MNYVHEHADHPDYRMVVLVDYTGEINEADVEVFRSMFLEVVNPTDQEIRKTMH